METFPSSNSPGCKTRHMPEKDDAQPLGYDGKIDGLEEAEAECRSWSLVRLSIFSKFGVSQSRTTDSRFLFC